MDKIIQIAVIKHTHNGELVDVLYALTYSGGIYYTCPKSEKWEKSELPKLGMT